MSTAPHHPAAPADGGSAVAGLERLLGTAADPGNPTGSRAVLAADERQEPLAAGEQLLDRYGLAAHVVPESLGGRLTRLDQLIDVMRTVYRRDPALGLARGAGPFMAAVNVWTAGRPEQRAHLARALLSGSTAACAYHELAQGNDLGRAGVTALPAPPPDTALLLNGRKEVIANLRRADTVVLFARTGRASGSRSHSQLLLDTAALPVDRVRHLDRFRTTGMRGVPLGGVEFTDCPVPADSVIGAPGLGLETALRSFQLTRIALPGMTAGLLDSAIRTALRCATGRPLYGRTAADLPLSRTLLAESFADLLLADAFLTVAARAAHTAPARTAIPSSAVKALVPRILMSAVHRLSQLMGSQFYLRTGEHALFQKLLRDGLPSSFGHASRASCLAGLLPQLPLVARRTWTNPGAEPLPAATFRLADPLPPLRFDALAVTASGRDPLARSLTSGPASHAPDGTPEGDIGAAARSRTAELAALAADCRDLRPEHLAPTAPAHGFALAERWTGILAASACIGLWHHHDTGGPLADPVWVLAALHRLDAHQGRHRDHLPPHLTEPLYAELVRREAAGRTFDLGCHPTGA
ncbi:acyl-CoA dehydrogenase family protein [Streptomyces sp. NPDC001889]